MIKLYVVVHEQVENVDVVETVESVEQFPQHLLAVSPQQHKQLDTHKATETKQGKQGSKTDGQDLTRQTDGERPGKTDTNRLPQLSLFLPSSPSLSR